MTYIHVKCFQGKKGTFENFSRGYQSISGKKLSRHNFTECPPNVGNIFSVTLKALRQNLPNIIITSFIQNIIGIYIIGKIKIK